VRHVLGWLAAWLGLFWLWLLLAGDWNRIEIVAAACGATVAATIAETARSRAGVAPRIPLRWVGRAWTVPHQIVIDFAIITWALLRSVVRREVVRGEFRAHPFPAHEGAGVRAWAAWAAQFSPNAYVVEIDAERELVLVHDLVPHRPSEEPV
jgi:multisubunit Na+/H+ antiporter MnhE subunit